MGRQVVGVQVDCIDPERLEQLLQVAGLQEGASGAVEPEDLVLNGLARLLAAVAGQEPVPVDVMRDDQVEPTDDHKDEQYFAPEESDHPAIAQIIAFYASNLSHDQVIPEGYRTRLATYLAGYQSYVAGLPEAEWPSALDMTILSIFIVGLARKKGDIEYKKYVQVAQIYQGALTDRPKPPFAQSFVAAFRGLGTFMLAKDAADATAAQPPAPLAEAPADVAPQAAGSASAVEDSASHDKPDSANPPAVERFEPLLPDEVGGLSNALQTLIDKRYLTAAQAGRIQDHLLACMGSTAAFKQETANPGDRRRKLPEPEVKLMSALFPERAGSTLHPIIGLLRSTSPIGDALTLYAHGVVKKADAVPGDDAFKTLAIALSKYLGPAITNAPNFKAIR